MGQVFAFMIAGTIFVSSMGFILLESGRIDQGIAQHDDLDLGRESRSIVDTLFSSSGVGWEDGNDSVRRVGLQNSDGAGLDRGQLAALRGGTLEADASNGFVDYEEAARSLGLDPDSGTQFHIRMYPVGLTTIAYEYNMHHMRAGMVGDYNGLTAVTADFYADTQSIADDANARMDVYAEPHTLNERRILEDAGFHFNDEIQISPPGPEAYVDVLGIEEPITDVVPAHQLEGDVFPDQKQYLNDVLSTRLSQYDVFFIGTGVDQSALTSAATKHAVRDYVLDGGILIVMGSDDQNLQWLQPIFDAGVTTADGGLFAPDVDHPLLKVPHKLDWGEYDHHDLVWDIDDKDMDKFNHVVTDGNDPVFAVSSDGAFGDGRLFLTTYRPGEIADIQGFAEAGSFLDNIAVYAERNDLYLEYGPAIPRGVEVVNAVRMSHIEDELLGAVPVRMEVFTWRT